MRYTTISKRSWNTEQYLKEDLLILSEFLTFSYSCIIFSIMSLQALMHKETSRQKSTLYIDYFYYYTIVILLSFYYLMYYIVLETYFGGHFSEECFYCYSQQYLLQLNNPWFLHRALSREVPLIDLKIGTHTK